MKGFDDEWQAKVGARLVGRGRISGRLYDLGEYPGAVLANTDSRKHIKGELYELRAPEPATRFLDPYEGFVPDRPQRSLFVRTIAPVTLEDGRTEKAWVYVYNRPVIGARLIPGGDYRNW